MHNNDDDNTVACSVEGNNRIFLHKPLNVNNNVHTIKIQ